MAGKHPHHEYHDQVLHIDPPNELHFKGPFKDVVISELHLSNPSHKRVLFKVKTTAPKRYCVRPNSGMIDSQGEVTVSVMLQPFEYDPNEKNKHKFMVQAMYAPEGEIDHVEQLWKEANPEELMDSKLKCVFDVATDTAHSNSNITTDTPVIHKMSSTPEMVQPKQKEHNWEEELKHVRDDRNRLQNEIQKVVAENQKLKDEGVRLRKVAMSDTTKSSSPMSYVTATAHEDKGGMQLPPVVFLIIALVLGFLIAKLLL